MNDITVLIPAYNSERTLAETLESLIMQNFKDFNVLIVDDGSSDQTIAVAKKFISQLNLEIFSLSKNSGISRALNHGLSHIQSKYIARLDADDLAMPTRLKEQFDYLESHPNIDVCSSWMELFLDNSSTQTETLSKPEHDAAIKTSLIQYTSMTHGASMFRKSFFDDVGVFDSRLDFAEDYDLWCRGALLGKCYTNLQENLSRYRQHNQQISHQKRQLQYERDLQIKRKYISALLGGESSGYLAEFFSTAAVFTSKEVAVSVIHQSMPLILKLGHKVHDEQIYATIVSGCMARHLRYK